MPDIEVTQGELILFAVIWTGGIVGTFLFECFGRWAYPDSWGKEPPEWIHRRRD